MTVENNGRADQIAGRDIINCHGGVDCPWRGEDAPESRRQAEFANTTGIWCSADARQQLERLMSHHDFTAPRLRTAWRSGSLVWDTDRRQLTVMIHWTDLAFGYAAAALMLTYYVLEGGQIVFAESQGGWRGVVAFLTATLLYGGLTWLALRFVILPHRVAARVQRVLTEQ